MITKPKTPEEWGKTYEEKYPKFQNFTIKIKILIADLLKKNNIDAQIEFRAKDIESFIDKIYRKENKYEYPLKEITDLVGIRIIAYNKEDVKTIGEIIKNDFDVDWKNSIDKIEVLDPDRFGYLSVHYVISLANNRKKLSEWEAFKDIKAEIQVRTILQHAWAYIDTKLGWKTRKEAPKDLQRKLFCLSALFEIADNEFSNLLKLKEKTKESYTEEVKSGEMNIELNMSSLEAYFDTTRQHLEWSKIAANIGYFPFEKRKLSYNWLRQEIEHRRILMDLLPLIGITTIEELDKTLKNASKWGKDVLTKIYENSKNLGFIPFANPYEVIIFLAFYDKKDVLNKQIIEKVNFVEAVKWAIEIVTGSS